jgi:multidrug efflux pump subunit AcrA (membrane-fusion protein)
LAKRKNNRRRTALGVIIAVLVVGLLGGGIAYAASRNGSDAHRYVTATAAMGTVDQKVSLTGTVAKANQATARFPVAGTVTQVFAQIGDQVNAGAPLAQLDTTSLQQAVDTAQANLDQAKQTAAQLTSASDLTKNAPSLQDIIGSASAGLTAQLAGAQGQISSAMTSLTAAQQALRKAMSAVNASCGQLPLDPSQWPSELPSGVPTDWPSWLPTTLPSSPSSNPSDSPSATSTPTAGPSSPSATSTSDAPIWNFDASAPPTADSSSAASSASPSASPGSTPTSTASASQSPTPSPSASATPSATATPTATPSVALPSLPAWLGNLDLSSAQQCVTDVQALYTAQLTLGTAMGTAAQTMQTFMSAIASWQPQLNQSQLAGLAASLLSGSSTLDTATARVVAEVSVKRAQDALATAQANLDGATLTAPVSGVVASMPFQAGTDATTTEGVTILGAGGIQVTVDISVAQMRLVKVGQDAVISQAGNGALNGVVSQKALLPTSSTGSASYQVLIAADGANVDSFLEGTGAAVTITEASSDDALTIPVSGVVADAGSKTGTVLKLVNGTAQSVKVDLGSIGTTRVAITSGLQAGDQVVLADSDIPLPDILQTLQGG